MHFGWFLPIAVYVQENRRLPLVTETEKQELEALRQALETEERAPLLDPWENRYQLYLDIDGDGFVRVGERRVKAEFYMYSTGPNRVDELGCGDEVEQALNLQELVLAQQEKDGHTTRWGVDGRMLWRPSPVVWGKWQPFGQHVSILN